METITAKNNDKIKYAVKLMQNASLRHRDEKFIIEGLRLCTDAAKTDINIEETYITEKTLDKFGEQLKILIDKSKRCFIISDEVSERLSDTNSSQGVFSLCKTIDKSDFIDKIKYTGVYIGVENIQTPDNLGAIARTAEALGLDGIVVSGGCDIYNPKAQRASMGSLFRLPVITVDNLPEFISVYRNKGMRFYAAVPDSSAVKITQIDKNGGMVCIVGNEGNGLTEETINACNEKVTIPMKGRAESLNAAAAAAVIMWEMIR